MRRASSSAVMTPPGTGGVGSASSAGGAVASSSALHGDQEALDHRGSLCRPSPCQRIPPRAPQGWPLPGRPPGGPPPPSSDIPQGWSWTPQ